MQTDDIQMLCCIQSNKLMSKAEIELETVKLGKVSLTKYSQNHDNQNQNFLFFRFYKKKFRL